MGFAFIMFIRLLFAACMVFIIGHVFGSFSKKPALHRITKVAAILAIVLFIISNVFLLRFRGYHPGWQHCDSTQQVRISQIPRLAPESAHISLPLQR